MKQTKLHLKKGFYIICSLVLVLGISAGVWLGARATDNEDTYNVVVDEDVITIESIYAESLKDPTAQRHLPFLFGFGDTLIASWSQHADTVVENSYDAIKISRDGGKTWGEKHVNSEFYFTEMVQLEQDIVQDENTTFKKGTLFGITYYTHYVDANTCEMIYWTSDDMGKTWTKHRGTVSLPNIERPESKWGFVFHKSLFQMEDGSLQGLMYQTEKGQPLNTCIWVKSTDGGKNWNFVSKVASGNPISRTGEPITDGEGFCEPTAAKCADGSILVVMRTAGGETVKHDLYQTRSYDNGITWSKPEMLPGISEGNSYSSDPTLLLLSNGTLVLSYGRPGCRMLVSLDGCGYAWEDQPIEIKEYDDETGYTGLAEVDGKVFVIGDTTGGWALTTGKANNIWGKYVTITRRQSENPALNSVNIYSGKNSIAINEGGVSLTCRGFDQDKRLFDISSAQKKYKSSNENVVSIDENGILTAKTEGEVSVCVEVTVGDTTVTSNEINIKVCGSMNTFETTEVGSLPDGIKGYIIKGGAVTEDKTIALVSEEKKYSGEKSLCMSDNDTQSMVGFGVVDEDGNLSNEMTIEFKIYPDNVQDGGILLRFYSETVTFNGYAFGLYLTKEGEIKYTPDGNSYKSFTPKNTILMNQWNTVKVKVSASEGTMTVTANDVTYTVAAAKRTGITATTLGAVTFESASTGGKNCAIYIDDLIVY